MLVLKNPASNTHSAFNKMSPGCVEGDEKVKCTTVYTNFSQL